MLTVGKNISRASSWVELSKVSMPNHEATLRDTAGYSSGVISRSVGMIQRSRGAFGVELWVE